ncbi:MAG: hypothetical protein BGO43_12715 [Gammaproteobacteria bacterium 39-13]|nr:MAG: hypothetical protein BGO43_12715 [Gammaproteobacteria bacterium 39-13]
MWPNTMLTKKLNIQIPIIQAPMAGGVTSASLIANVSKAGGLGSLGAAYLSPQDMQKTIQDIRKKTDNPFAVNLFIPQSFEVSTEKIAAMAKIIQKICPELNLPLPSIEPPYIPSFDQQFEIILAENIPILSFIFGSLSNQHITLCKQKGIVLIGTATTLIEAQTLEQQGIDIIVAQGAEAGGHRGSFQNNAQEESLSTSALLLQLTQHIHKPIVAAGGIMQASDIVTMITNGAAGVQMGSAFLCCEGSLIAPAYRKILLNAKKDLTVLTRAFSGRIARGIRNQFIDRMTPFEQDILPFPVQNAITSMMRQQAKKQDNAEFMSLWAGQRAFLCKAHHEGKFIETLHQEVVSLLKQL